MQPGELVTLRAQSQQLEKQTVNPERYTSWTEQRLDFDRTPLSEIARTIEETYGYEVIIQGKELPQRRFQGSVPAEDLDILLDGLAETFDILITTRDKQIIIQPSPK